MYHKWKDESTEGSITKLGGTGNCIFLTDALVLTVLHMTEDPYDYLFYRTADTIVSIAHPNLFDGGHVKDVVAISPRYDLALFRVEESVPSVLPVPIKTASGDVFSYLSIQSSADNNEIVYTIQEETFARVEETDGSYMTREGSLFFPSLVMDTPIRHGYSGSPVFDQDWNLVGLISKGRFGENEIQSKNAIVSDHVYDFLNCVVHQPDCTGWENTAPTQ